MKALGGQLRHEREGSLLGAKIGEAQRRIRVEDDAEHHAVEVVALGHHLGAEQDPGLRGLEARQDHCCAPAALGDVGVEAKDRKAGVA